MESTTKRVVRNHICLAFCVCGVLGFTIDCSATLEGLHNPLQRLHFPREEVYFFSDHLGSRELGTDMNVSCEANAPTFERVSRCHVYQYISERASPVRSARRKAWPLYENVTLN